MLSSASKAFSTPARALIQNRARSSIVSRFMSTEGSGETIVDICKGKIMKALETDEVTVTGAYDDPNGSHISVTVVSEKFEGKRAVQRQQMVYKALWDELKGSNAPVHAVDAMICKTPAEV
ncbi:hypothetical protein CTEN210_00161 [Chaetoceros tenuissimus]|uniref:BolA-like protein n=1 Tax=Chaetoceros tenuissimus TaxID=426638 RepID=A0AAD3CDB4_9STRA|nr:hypothetical protein CTEN210_00161 [Chaetoceros tenuissimus]